MSYKNVLFVVLLALVDMMLSACGSCGENETLWTDGTCHPNPTTPELKEIKAPPQVEKAVNAIVDSPAGKAAGEFIKDGQDGLERQAYQAIDGMKQQVSNSPIGQAADALKNSPVGMPVACLDGKTYQNGTCK